GSTWTAATGAVYESSVPVIIGAGTGEKSWSLSLPSTFYDLCRDTETFVVYVSARDQVNNPLNAQNVESSATVKLVFSYRSSTSTVTNMVPVPGSASNVSQPMSFDIVPAEGGRTSVAWFVAVDTDGYYWTASSWSANKYPGTGGLGLGDPLPLAVNISTPWIPGAVWLTTAAHTGKPPGSPDMAFEPGTTPDGLSLISLAFTDATTLKTPVWVNGRKYKMYGRTRNTAFQHHDTGAQSFIFDVYSPTMTGHYFLRNLANTQAGATPLSDITYASGTITDNVSDITDLRQVYMRVKDTNTNKYLNPATLVNIDISVADNAWAVIEQTNDEWYFDLSNAKFVAGNTYEIEFYAKDQAGNKHILNCPYNEGDPAGNCLTGDAATPRYKRYFKVDKAAPTLAISTPSVTVPNNIGAWAALATITGTANDLGFGVNLVEYSLAFDQGDPTWHWQHFVTSGEWKTGYVGDIWNRACDPAVGCGASGGTWAVWQSSNIAWVDSQKYYFQARAVDAAGNVSSVKTMYFNFDTSTPTSKVTTAGGAYTTRMAAIAGTLQDEISTGTPSGLDSQGFRVAIKRLSDNYWWCDPALACGGVVASTWVAATGLAFESSNTVVVGVTGLQAWSLSLPATFYDLLKDTDTFRVYAWAKDQSNNPAGSAHVESSTTVKLVFSYKSSTPTLTSIWPPGNSAQNAVSSVTLSLDPIGGRITQAWAVFLDTNSYWWTGSSWSATTTTDPPPPPAPQSPLAWQQGNVWLTTAAPQGSPDMTFVPGTSPDGTSALGVTFDGATLIRLPSWQNGRRYKVYARARNTAQQHLDTGVALTTHVFVYDVTAPTVTAHNAIMSLSTSNLSGDYSWVASWSLASGTVKDNVSDTLDYRQIYVRILEEDSGKYLNPNTFIKFDWTDGDTAWSRQDTIADEWAFDLSQSQFSSGFKYRLEIYGQDGAQNYHESAACPVVYNSDTGCQTGRWTTTLNRPKYRRYFIYDKTRPIVAITTPTVTNPNYIGGSYNLVTLSGTASDNGANDRVEFSLALNAADPTHHWEHYATSGAWKLNTIGDIWNRAYPQGPVSDPWSVWTSSNIAWFESDSYILKVRAIDKAGNAATEATLLFLYDKAKPASKITNIVNMQVYTTQVLSIDGTAIDDTSTSTGTSSGLSSLGVKITRESDGYHWNGSTWAAPATSSITVSIGQGTGLKIWSLALNTTFYDLLQVQRDTFTVYCWGTDMVVNPPPPDGSPNKESDTEIKVKYVFQTGYPQVSVWWPPAASAQNSLSSVTLNINAIGAGVQQAWVTFISSDDAYWWTSSSWSLTPSGFNGNPEAYNLWLTTNDAGGGGPDMLFVPALSQSDIRINFGYSTHTILMPAWAQIPNFGGGKKFKIFLKAKNTANQTTSSYPGTYAFIYDVQRPTVTLSSSLGALSNDSGARSWVRQMDKVDGNMEDNTADGLNIYSVFVKLFSVDQGKCLSAAAPPQFNLDCPGPADGWKEVQVTGSQALRPWEWDIAGADFTGGFSYNLEVYGQDRARNSTGTATAPLFKKYFKWDNDKPLLSVSTPVAGGAYGLNGIDRIMGYSSDPTAVSPKVVEYRLEYPVINKWEVMSSSYGVWRVQDPQIWNVAATTTTVPYQTWQSSNIAWVNGEQFTLYVRAIDAAGNYSNYSTTTFKYDFAVPVSTVTKPVSGRTYSQQLATVSGTTKDMPDTNRQAGLQSLRIGIRRQSDWKWWNGAQTPCTTKCWQAVRDDPVVTLPVSPGVEWTHDDFGGFWTGVPAAETFEAYAWAKDLVDKPDPSYRNVESSTTVEAVFRYEIQAPTSTVILPIHNAWYSGVAGYRLVISSGRAVDLPETGPGSGAIVTGSSGKDGGMQIQIQRSVVNRCWNAVSAFDLDCGGESSWHDMTYVAVDTWTYAMYPDLFNATLDGEQYRVRMRGRDSARDGTESWSPNVESVFETGRNEKNFRVDKTPGTSLIQRPNTPNVGTLATVSGTASDSNSGADMVHVAYQKSGGAEDGCWWVVGTANTWSDCGSNDPPESHFVPSSTQTAVPVPWEVSGGSIPALATNQQYRIFARATDKVGNKMAFPGTANCTTPPTQSACVVFTKTGAEPQSYLVAPGLGTPHYKPASLTLIEGTLSDATTAQIRLINTTPEPDKVWQGATWVDTNTYAGLLGCTDSNYVVDQSTCGFHGVGNMSWQRDVTGIWPAGTNEIKVQARAVDGVTVEATPFEERAFVIDGDPPAVSVTLPAKSAYQKGELVLISVLTTDPSPGQITDSTAKFKLIRATDSYQWNGEVFYSTNALLTGANQGGGVFTYADAKLADQSVFVDGARYKVVFQVDDKAGNQTISPESPGGSPPGFRHDASTPVATMDVPGDGFFIRFMNLSSGTLSASQTRDPDPYPTDPGGDTEPSGLEAVEVALQRDSNSQWFMTTPSTGFLSGTQVWHKTQVWTSSWTYTHQDLADRHVSGDKYRILVRARDKAGNVMVSFSNPVSSRTYVVDNSSPTVGVTYPAADGTIWRPASLTQLTGTAREEPSAAAVSGFLVTSNDDVDIELSHLSGNDTYYWNITNWSLNTPAFVSRSRELSGPTTFWRLLPLPNNTDPTDAASWQVRGDQTYRLRVRGRDKAVTPAGAPDRNLSAWSGYRTFVMDTTPPISSMTWPVEAIFTNNITSITGTASAAIAGIDKVELKITTNTATGPYWDGKDRVYTFVETWSTAAVAGNAWEFTNLFGAGQQAFFDHNRFYVWTRATDLAGNVETSPPLFSVVYDTSPPDLGIKKPENNPNPPYYSNNAGSARPITLTSGTVSDIAPLASGVTEVWVAISSGTNVWWTTSPAAGFLVNQATISWSTNVYVSGTDWTYTPAWTLSDGITYKVFVMARDKAGACKNCGPNGNGTNMLPTDSLAGQTQEFHYDIAYPTSTTTLPENSTKTASVLQFKGLAFDPGSDASGIQTVWAAVQHTDGSHLGGLVHAPGHRDAGFVQHLPGRGSGR
ncbi:MAG: Ig-like domain repeat protein, partial [Elusimicrobia bacterium]|nr:Ig-like domain repeat protein [Elusimicrobiota bacterium]